MSFDFHGTISCSTIACKVSMVNANANHQIIAGIGKQRVIAGEIKTEDIIMRI